MIIYAIYDSLDETLCAVCIRTIFINIFMHIFIKSVWSILHSTLSTVYKSFIDSCWFTRLDQTLHKLTFVTNHRLNFYSLYCLLTDSTNTFMNGCYSIDSDTNLILINRNARWLLININLCKVKNIWNIVYILHGINLILQQQLKTMHQHLLRMNLAFKATTIILYEAKRCIACKINYGH